MDGVALEVNARMLGRGLSLVSDDGRASQVDWLLFADGTALVKDSNERLKQLVE